MNYSRNSELVVDEEELKWVTNEQKDSVIIKTVPKTFILNPLVLLFSHSSEMQK